MDKYGFLLDDDRCAVRRMDSNGAASSAGSVGSDSRSRSSAARDTDAKRLEELLDKMNPTNQASYSSQPYSNMQSKVKYYARRGLPDDLRQKAWTVFTDVDLLIYKHPGEYELLVDRAEEEWIMYELERNVDEFQGNQTPICRLRKALGTIERDINRTFPNHVLFHSDEMNGLNQGSSHMDGKSQLSEGEYISDEEENGDNIEVAWADFSVDDLETTAQSMGTDAASIVEEKKEMFNESFSRSMKSLFGHLSLDYDEESDDDPTVSFDPFGGIERKGSVQSGTSTGTVGEGKDMLRRVLRAYSLYDSDIGYCQGMNFITAMFLTFLSEEEAFWLLVVVMKNKPYKLRELFSEDMRGTHEVLYLAEKLLAQFLPKLSKHLEEEGVHISMFVTQWLLTVYTSTFPFDLVARVWDSFLVEGWKVVYRVMLALLEHASNDMLTMRFEEILAFIKEFPSRVDDAKTIMDRSLKIPLKSKHIQKHVTEWRRHASTGGQGGGSNTTGSNTGRDTKTLFISKLSGSASGDDHTSVSSIVSRRNTSKSDGPADSRSTTNPTIFINTLPSNELCRPLRSSMRSQTLHESLHGNLRHKSRPQCSVSFTSVSIREYERILGDNPSVTSGPPIGIGWRHLPEPISINVDDYETAKGEPRDSTEFLLDYAARESILLEHTSVSQREIVAAIKSVRKEKWQRQKTVVNLNMSKAEEKAEVAKRKAQRMFNKFLSDEALEAKLWHDAHAIALQKSEKLEERIQQGESISSRDLYSVGTPVPTFKS